MSFGMQAIILAVVVVAVWVAFARDVIKHPDKADDIKKSEREI